MFQKLFTIIKTGGKGWVNIPESANIGLIYLLYINQCLGGSTSRHPQTLFNKCYPLNEDLVGQHAGMTHE